MSRSGAVTHRAALRVADVEAGRVPDRCVLSGVRTSTAVRAPAASRGAVLSGVVSERVAALLWHLAGVRTIDVVVPITRSEARRWHTCQAMAAAVTAAGCGLLLAALAGRLGRDAVIAGVLLVIGGRLLRWHWWRSRWIALSLDPAEGVVRLARVSEPFAAAARDAFVRSTLPRTRARGPGAQRRTERGR